MFLRISGACPSPDSTRDGVGAGRAYGRPLTYVKSDIPFESRIQSENTVLPVVPAVESANPGVVRSTIMHCRHFLPPPVTRRELLTRCANGFGAVALSALLADGAWGAETVPVAATGDPLT